MQRKENSNIFYRKKEKSMIKCKIIFGKLDAKHNAKTILPFRHHLFCINLKQLHLIFRLRNT